MEQIARTPKQIGEALRRSRRSAGVTQISVAERADLRQATISTIEAGSPGVKLETLCDLLAALNLGIVIRPRSQGASIDIGEIF